MSSTSPNVLKVLLAIFLSPLGVFLHVGIGMRFWINLILTLLFYFPGLVHALYVISKD